MISALYGLPMLLPQSEAFNLVRGRLACVSHLQKQDKEGCKEVQEEEVQR